MENTFKFEEIGDPMRNYYREINEYLKKLIHYIVTSEKKSRKSGNLPLTLSEILVLRELGRNGAKKIFEMMDTLELDRNTLVTITKKLAMEGYIEKVPAPDDKRSAELKLTGQGELLYQQVEEKEKKLISNILDDFTVNEEITILKFLVKLELLSRGKLPEDKKEKAQVTNKVE